MLFRSLQGWLCVGVLCALQCAKNSVGSGRQSHGCLYMCRMFNRVTHNVWALRQAGQKYSSRPVQKPVKSTEYNVKQNDD